MSPSVHARLVIPGPKLAGGSIDFIPANRFLSVFEDGFNLFSFFPCCTSFRGEFEVKTKRGLTTS